jgi:hypothetical protein
MFSRKPWKRLRHERTSISGFLHEESVYILPFFLGKFAFSQPELLVSSTVYQAILERERGNNGRFCEFSSRRMAECKYFFICLPFLLSCIAHKLLRQQILCIWCGEGTEIFMANAIFYLYISSLGFSWDCPGIAVFLCGSPDVSPHFGQGFCPSSGFLLVPSFRKVFCFQSKEKE